MGQYIDTDQVIRYFLLFADLDEEESERWRDTCACAAAALTGRLRKEVDTAAHREELSAAAALWAYGDYRLVAAGQAPPGSEIKVGDIAVKQSAAAAKSAVDEAKEYRNYALAQVSHLLAPSEGGLFAV